MESRHRALWKEKCTKCDNLSINVTLIAYNKTETKESEIVCVLNGFASNGQSPWTQWGVYWSCTGHCFVQNYIPKKQFYVLKQFISMKCVSGF